MKSGSIEQAANGWLFRARDSFARGGDIRLKMKDFAPGESIETQRRRRLPARASNGAGRTRNARPPIPVRPAPSRRPGRDACARTYLRPFTDADIAPRCRPHPFVRQPACPCLLSHAVNSLRSH
ncbi:hypothetical protein C7S16_1258 [Burkholderia thailandensis]|uniref:Uncharacterized protein n=1 Tax=Burkholderia thailandensis TaxID=57975 RepID=A0AAW9CYH4_BURTH|nr:hypothetical protein [Burkholderia thailandensis]MDW9255955.1 hypothetical protein [Burkholderia thailandensis]